MIGAQIFNKEAGKSVTEIWGCATTASEWRFLKLKEKNLYVDKNSYSVRKIDELLGVFKKMFENISN